MSLSDEEIIQKIRSGEERYFSQIVDRYKDRAMTLALRMLKNRQDAEEAAQDAFVRAYNGLDKFQGASRFGTWFYRIVYNVCLTKLGKAKEAFQTSEYSDESDYKASVSLFSSGPHPGFEQKDTIDFIRKCIGTLPAKYATILSLFYFQELSHQEICEVTQLPLGTVKVHLFRARAQLYGLLQKDLEMGKAV